MERQWRQGPAWQGPLKARPQAYFPTGKNASDGKLSIFCADFYGSLLCRLETILRCIHAFKET